MRLLEKVPKPVRDAAAELRDKDVLLLAAGLGFYGLVSIAPLVIVAAWVTSQFVGDQNLDRAARWVASATPSGMGIDGLLKAMADAGPRLGIAAAVMALWPASAYGSGLRRSFETLAGNRTKAEGFFGRALAVAALLPLFIVFTVFGAYAGSRLLGNDVTGVFGWAVAVALAYVGSWLVTWVAYRFFPSDPLDAGRRSVVTTIVAGIIAALSVGIVIYLNVGADFEQHYATSSMAGLVFIGLWLFLSNAALLSGYVLGRRE